MLPVMSQPIVRPARPHELESCAALISGLSLFEPYGLTPARLLHALSGTMDPVLVALEGEEVRGFAWIAEKGAFARDCYLRLLVAPGVGAVLMDEVESRAAGDVFLLVNRDNEGAQRFYQRRGYVVVGQLDSYVAPGVDELLMRRTTGPAARSWASPSPVRPPN